MKRLNRKGFTLIELLAVIVVLAIILVITVPMILNTLSSTRQDALQASANSIAKFYEEQIRLKALGKGDDSFKIYFAPSGIVGPGSPATLSKGGELCRADSYGIADLNECNFLKEAFTSDYWREITRNEAVSLDLNTTDYNISTSTNVTPIDLSNHGTITNKSVVWWTQDGKVTVQLCGKAGGKFDGLCATSNN